MQLLVLTPRATWYHETTLVCDWKSKMNPYEKWLGLSVGDKPPDFFQLLGIGRDEQDPETIKVIAGRASLHHLNRATGEPEGHRPH